MELFVNETMSLLVTIAVLIVVVVWRLLSKLLGGKILEKGGSIVMKLKEAIELLKSNGFKVEDKSGLIAQALEIVKLAGYIATPTKETPDEFVEDVKDDFEDEPNEHEIDEEVEEQIEMQEVKEPIVKKQPSFTEQYYNKRKEN